MSKNRYTPPKYRRDHPFCRWCSVPIDPLKWTCSPACDHEWKLRANPVYLREQVWLRDRGVCALCAKSTVPSGNPVDTGHLWQVDHIVRVSEGGGECGLDGVRTLCTDCHIDVSPPHAKGLMRGGVAYYAKQLGREASP